LRVEKGHGNFFALYDKKKLEVILISIWNLEKHEGKTSGALHLLSLMSVVT